MRLHVRVIRAMQAYNRTQAQWEMLIDRALALEDEVRNIAATHRCPKINANQCSMQCDFVCLGHSFVIIFHLHLCSILPVHIRRSFTKSSATAKGDTSTSNFGFLSRVFDSVIYTPTVEW